jgi:hypothetical protein
MADEVPDARPSSQFVFEESRRLLVRQEADLDTVRGRAVQLLSAASLVAGLFGSRSFGGHYERPCIVLLAIVAFGLTVTAVMFIIWPRTFRFSHSLETWTDAMKAQSPKSAEQFFSTMAAGMQKDRAQNQSTISVMYGVLMIVCILVGVQVVLWAVAAA